MNLSANLSFSMCPIDPLQEATFDSYLISPLPNPQSPAFIIGAKVIRPLIDISMYLLTNAYNLVPSLKLTNYSIIQRTANDPLQESNEKQLSVPCKSQHKPSPVKNYYLEVEPNWKIYVEESGNPGGIPVVFVHGGPGAHFKDSDHHWFDPNKYRILLFQQRGTYKCSPSAEDLSVDAAIFKNISIETLARDVETLRNHLGISKWLVFGGSWGSTLGLYYAQEYPQSCLGLVLRGIFLSSQEEISNFYSFEMVNEKIPKWNQTALKFLKDYATRQGLDASPEQLCRSYSKMIIEMNDIRAAAIWRRFEKYVESMGSDESLQTLLNEDLAATGEERSTGLWESHLFNQITGSLNLLEESRLKKLNPIPVKIVQGKLDPICPAHIAVILAKNLQQFGVEVDISLVEEGLHSAYSHPGMIDALVHATDQFALNYKFRPSN